MGEETREHIPAVVVRGGAAKIDLAQLLAVAGRPAAMIPRADHEEILLARIVLLQQLVDLERTVEILLIPPARDVERRHRDAVQPRRKRLPLPEGVVVRMAHEIIPG